MEKIFKDNAVFNGKYYDHFGIHPSIASMYGHKPEEIQEVKFKISADQTIPEHDNSMDVDYWGWFDNNKQEFSMIYAKHFLLEMCFPYGIKACEDKNQGKAYRIEIIK